jgi:hypothetical protein
MVHSSPSPPINKPSRQPQPIHKLQITLSLAGYTLDEYYARYLGAPATVRTIMGPYSDATIPAAYLTNFTAEGQDIKPFRRWLVLNEFPWIPDTYYPTTHRVRPIVIAEASLPEHEHAS